MITPIPSFPRRRESSNKMTSRSEPGQGFVSHRENSIKSWIPACAGMTQVERAHPMHQRGFSLITAIFLLVVIAALGTFAVTLSTTQHQSEAMDVMGKRAYQAARAGIEWGAFQIIQSDVSGTSFAADCRSVAGARSGVPLAAQQLAMFNVDVACSTGAASHVDGHEVWIYSVSASAATAGVTAGNPGYIERQLSVTIAQ